MRPKPENPAAPRDNAGGTSPASRCVARGEGWWINEFVCCAGPGDAPFEERHGAVSISAVVEGSFQYRSSAGRALLYPGAFLLGNAGTCFECGHEHGTGDRCIAFQFASDYFAEIGATAGGSSRFHFTVPLLPALPEMTGLAVSAQHAAFREEIAAEELAVAVAERALALTSGHRAAPASPSALDEKRISRALRHMEEFSGEPIGLDGLAGIAAMSKYHFLRSFRRVVGLTPYQYLLGLRLRQAALKLTTTARPVAAIALEAGFGDISTFNARFRRIFGRSPSSLRAG